MWLNDATGAYWEVAASSMRFTKRLNKKTKYGNDRKKPSLFISITVVELLASKRPNLRLVVTVHSVLGDHSNNKENDNSAEEKTHLPGGVPVLSTAKARSR